jgi:hypothetical protein
MLGVGSSGGNRSDGEADWVRESVEVAVDLDERRLV